MTQHEWFIEQIATYLAGGLDEAEAARFAAHRESCPTCAALAAEGERADLALRELFASAAPAENFEHRLVESFRDSRRRWALLAHPAVVRIGSAVAAALILGGVGVTANYVLNQQDRAAIVAKHAPGRKTLDVNRIAMAFKAPGAAEIRARFAGSATRPSDAGYSALPDPSKLAKEINGEIGVRMSSESSVRNHRVDIDKDVREARRLIYDGKYNEAMNKVDKILAKDPGNDYANGVKQLMTDKANLAEEAKYRDQNGDQIVKHLNDAEEKKIPYSDIMRYPDNWPDSSRMRDEKSTLEDQRKAKALEGEVANRTSELEKMKEVSDVAEALRKRVDPAGLTKNGEVTWNTTDRSGATVDWGLKTESDTRTGSEVTRKKLDAASVNKNGAGTLTITGTNDHTIHAPLTLNSSGSLTLGGNSSYDGTTTLSGGSIVVGSSGALGTGAGTSAGTLDLNGTLAGGASLTDTGGTVNGKFAPSGHEAAYHFDTPAQAGQNQGGAQKTGAAQGQQPGNKAADSYRYAGVTQLANAPAASYFKAGDVAKSRDGKETVGIITGDRSNPGAVALENKPADTGGKENDKPTGATNGDPAGGNTAKPEPAVDPAVKAAMEAAALRKIIRNGDMEFEVEAFDSAFIQIAKIVQEERGFVASNNSEKLPNGKVKGTIVVRVPPEHLDVLVLKLRALGELKSQRIVAQDITKQYTDMASELRAARAMETRLLEIIKSGKGDIKDLLEAEKQLGVWREKIEKIEGEVRYYDNLVALSTLSISLAEKDIRAPQYAAETEQVSMAVESDDVEKTYADAQKAITEAKGRVISSDLKKYDAGQLQAKIECAVAPESAGPLIDRLKQLGRVSRLDIERKQTTGGGTGAPAGIKVERKETVFSISLFNIANIAPRETVNLNIACDDVETVYRDIIALVELGDKEARPATTQPAKVGRIVSSSLNRQRADQITGIIGFEVPSAGAARIQEMIRAKGEVMRLAVTENPDTNNITRAKRGYNVQLFSMSQVQPRETTTIAIAAAKVPDAYRGVEEKIADLVTKRKARVLGAQLNEQDRANVNGTLDFEVQRAEAPALIAMLGGLGDITSRNVTRSADMENTVDSKVRLQISLSDEARLLPREATRINAAAKNVPDAYYKLLDVVHQVGRVINSQINEQDRSNISGIVEFDIPRSERGAVEKLLEPPVVEVLTRNVARSADAQNTTDKKIRLAVCFIDEVRLGARETTTMQIVALAVPDAYAKVLEMARAKGRVLSSTLNEQNRDNVTAVLDFEVPQDQKASVEQLIGSLTDITSRSVSRSQDQQTTTEKKVRLQLSFSNAQQQAPREMTTVALEVGDVEKTVTTVVAAAEAAGGGVAARQVAREDSGQVKGTVVIDVPINKAAEMRRLIETDLGSVRVNQASKNPNVPEGKFTRARFEVILATGDSIVPANDGVGASIKGGLQTVMKAFAWALRIIIVGLVFVVPCLLLLWAVVWGVRRFILPAKTKATGAAPAAA